MFRYIKSIKERDPAARNFIQILLLYPGVHAMFYYRIARLFWLIKLKLIAEIITYISKFFTRIEIHPGARIGKRLFIDHGFGVVIGETTIIGNDCTLYQNVTLGGSGKEHCKRHPTLGNNVMVGAGALILGNITIGDNVKIGAGTIVLDNIESNKTVVGAKGKVIN